MSERFSFAGEYGDNPLDYCDQMKDVLDAVSLIFMGVEPPDLSRRNASGIYKMLRGCILMTETIERLTAAWLDDPYRAGEAAARHHLNDEFHRGFTEATKSRMQARRAANEAA